MALKGKQNKTVLAYVIHVDNASLVIIHNNIMFVVYSEFHLKVGISVKSHNF